MLIKKNICIVNSAGNFSEEEDSEARSRVHNIRIRDKLTNSVHISDYV
jgi:hypothetical protein